MYDELVKSLRETRERVRQHPEIAMYVPPYQLSAAADAIEELSLVAESNERGAARWAETVAMAVEQIPRLVPVTERLPKDFESVLCWYEYYHYSKEKILPEYEIGYVINGRWCGEVTNGKDCKVLAWMQLPEPPKEE